MSTQNAVSPVTLGSPSDLFSHQRESRWSHTHRSVERRIEKLSLLRKKILELQNEIETAIHADFGRNPIETDLLEITPTLGELDFALKHMSEWTAPHTVSTPLPLLPAQSEVRYEAKGTTLVIGPWNYPVQLVLVPLISSVAAGNTVIVKPSEMTPHASRVIRKIIEGVFEANWVAVVEGGIETSQQLLAMPFDHFFYTGNGKVGRIVMEAAAKHLSSVTLELGGKSPVIVDRSADLKIAAEKIAWGKWINNGQTCVAPDYVLVHSSMKDALIAEIKLAALRMFSVEGQNEDFKNSPSYCRVVNTRHFERIQKLIENSVSQGAKLEWGGQYDGADRFISPTILSGVTWDHEVMKDEIFGPVLPVLEYQELSQVFGWIQDHDKPLALYIFAKNQDTIETILQNTTSGGCAVNDVTLHLANPHLPFGGVGASGLGRYHGWHGFKEFSHERAVFRQSRINAMKMLYPPYRLSIRKMLGMVKKLI
jgi:aldehyde dehydrogenase (NAD+)